MDGNTQLCNWQQQPEEPMVNYFGEIETDSIDQFKTQDENRYNEDSHQPSMNGIITERQLDQTSPIDSQRLLTDRRDGSM